MSDLNALLVQQFPSVEIMAVNDGWGIGSFSQWDSLAHFNFLLLVEQHFNVRFEPEELASMKTLGQIRAALSSRGLTV
ncbi:acyl carrier protein [Aeromonas sp. RU39B]|uniref:acyl carrier protein n=1 Tax=Aeromonas sp. RU39B TaxID=1907416 RepID=UPI00095605FF|nr:acyl carrier protein [Aeromonas sp. RU39B]SIR06569.1 acyl carrier protein [Aeromonas sp. RU39B]